METEDAQRTIIEHLDRLNEVVPAQRKADDEVRSLKAEVATLNVKLAAAEGKAGADISRLVERALMSW
jgi:hypothetical protein